MAASLWLSELLSLGPLTPPAEDALLFRKVRRVEPGLGSLIERLEADHREVADLLYAVEELANGLPSTEAEADRKPLAEALGRLHESLLAHLDLEERSLEPALRQLEPWTG